MWEKLVGVVFCSLIVSAQAFANPLEGSWRLISGKLIDGDQVTDYTQDGITSIKIIHGNHFSFVSHQGDDFYAAAAGTVEVTDELYAESPLQASYPPMLGNTYRFTYTLNDNIWEKKRFEDDELVEVELWERLPH